MRLRSTEAVASDAKPQPEGGDGFLPRAASIEHLLLPEQAALAKRLQSETGASFEECAVQLGYLPEGASSHLDYSDADIPNLSADEIDPLVVMLSSPNDPIAAASRELRSVLGTMRKRDGNPVRRVTLLSLEARSEGSILAANLAVACALSGQRTLLIDANFEDPMQHALFRRQGDKGVCQLLTNQASAPEVVQSTSVPKLDLLASGGWDHTTSELVEHGALSQATEVVSEKYSTVVIDAGHADQVGISCAQGFDGAIVLVQRDVTALSDARKLVERLRGREEIPVGLVVID